MSQREIVDNEGRYEECIAGTLTATSQWEVVIEPLCAKQRGLDLLAAACPSKGPHVILVCSPSGAVHFHQWTSSKCWTSSEPNESRSRKQSSY